jgi:uncharacterized protein
VSLDGIAEYHNARRMQKNDLPTFDQIFTHVTALAQRTDVDVQISIRCNVDRENYESVSLLLKQLAAAEIQDKISFYVAPIHSWGIVQRYPMYRLMVHPMNMLLNIYLVNKPLVNAIA